MNKIKKVIDNIKLSEQNKNKIFNNILESEVQKYSLFNFKAILRFATIILSIGIFSYTSVYAAAKIFNWNNKFLDFLGITQTEAENNGLKNTNIEKSIKIDDMNITVNEAAMFGDYIYVFLTYNFDTLDKNITIDDLNNNKIDLSIQSGENIYRGIHNFISLDQASKTAIAISELHVDNPINNKQIKINFHTDFVIEENPNDGTSVGWFETTNSIELELSIEKNKERIFSEFNEQVYLKNNDNIKIELNKLAINPIFIKLDINLYTDIENIEENDLKFDNTLNINFKDGSTIKLDAVSQDEKLIQGSNIIGGTIDENGNEIKQMTFTYSNIYNFDIYSKPDFNFINVDEITDIQIGNTIIK